MNDLLFVGLGNSGSRYEQTRHTIGMRAVRQWVSGMQSEATQANWKSDRGIGGEVTTVRVSSLQPSAQPSGVSRFLSLLRPVASGTVTVHCLLPMTGMNNSGEPVAVYLNQHPIDQSAVVIVHDDLELPLGQVEVVTGGSAKGHNGVRSIHSVLNSQQIARVRLGIGRPADAMQIDAFVLAPFRDDEQPLVTAMLNQAVSELTAFTQRTSPVT